MQTEKKILSVIVPVYNTVNELPRCIESIINQTYSNIQLILVDDGSNDGSELICDQYSSRYEYVITVHQNNMGHDCTVRNGRLHATGYYLGYVDCDDWIEPNMFEDMISEIEKEKADIAVCSYNHVYQDGRREAAWLEGEKVIYSAKEAVRCAIEDVVIQNYSWNKVYKMSLWKEIDLHGILVDDFCTTIETFLKSKKIICINHPLYNYNQREGSLLRTTDSMKVIEYNYKLFCTYKWRLNFLENIYPDFYFLMLEKLLRQGVSIYHYMMCEGYFGDKKKEIFAQLMKYKSDSKKIDKKLFFRIFLIGFGNTYEKIYLIFRHIKR